MTTANELRAGLYEMAKRSVSKMAACTNEESAKLYLVLPFVSLLGYDVTDPLEVYPNHLAATEGPDAPRADFAILRHGKPVIAIECVPVGGSLEAAEARLRAYFNADRTVKAGIATDGISFAFYVDAAVPHQLDDEPFFFLDCETLVNMPATDDVIETLLALTRPQFDPATLAETAHVLLVKKRLRKVLIEEAKAPSESFCRFALERSGISNVRRSSIERYYAPLVKGAFEDSLVLPVVEQLVAAGRSNVGGKDDAQRLLDSRVARSDRELSLITYIRRRLAFLSETEAQFAAIEEVQAKDYVGRVTFFLGRERKGRLFDFIEGADGTSKYVFPEPIGAIVTDNIRDIDEALRSVFAARVAELGLIALPTARAKIRA